MLVFLNPGHKVGIDSGAVDPVTGMQEAKVALEVAKLVKGYLEDIGIQVILLQSNSLNGEDEDWDNPSIVRTANESGADIFVSIHCNAFNCVAHGTEVEVYSFNSVESTKLANCIQNQIVNSLGTVDRGVRERPNLTVIKYTDMPAVLVEMEFIDSLIGANLLANNQDDFARAIARGITDYQLVAN